DIDNATELRSLEEAWDLQNTPMQPGGVEGAWSDKVEDEFRKTLTQAFTERVNVHMTRIANVLARYYRHLMKKGIERYNSLVNDLSERSRHAHDVPIPTLTGEPGKVDRKMKLCEYLAMLDEATVKFKPVAADYSE